MNLHEPLIYTFLPVILILLETLRTGVWQMVFSIESYPPPQKKVVDKPKYQLKELRKHFPLAFVCKRILKYKKNIIVRTHDGNDHCQHVA